MLLIAVRLLNTCFIITFEDGFKICRYIYRRCRHERIIYFCKKTLLLIVLFQDVVRVGEEQDGQCLNVNNLRQEFSELTSILTNNNKAATASK